MFYIISLGCCLREFQVTFWSAHLPRCHSGWRKRSRDSGWCYSALCRLSVGKLCNEYSWNSGKMGLVTRKDQ